jgi:hypothetical protein
LPDDDVVRFLREQQLSYPISSKNGFVEQMTRSQRSIAFQGRRYDVAAAVKLIPSFFFPIASERDLLAKVSDLLVARGLAPMSAEPL